MKKRMFRVLCVALALALLAPNVFAATPAPEVPLADEATVTRVKNEIAAGQITDMEDVFLVAYQHLGADIEEDGMTAYINEDGTLGFTCVIDSEKNRIGTQSAQNMAITSLALVDKDGRAVTDYESLYNTPGRVSYSDYGSLAEVSVYATHTTVFQTREYVEDGYLWHEVNVLYVVTTLNYNTTSFVASRLEQYYEYQDDPFTAIEKCDDQTVYTPAAGSHYFWPNCTAWEKKEGPNSLILTTSTVYIQNSNLTIELENTILLNSLHYNY